MTTVTSVAIERSGPAIRAALAEQRFLFYAVVHNPAKVIILRLVSFR